MPFILESFRGSIIQLNSDMTINQQLIKLTTTKYNLTPCLLDLPCACSQALAVRHWDPHSLSYMPFEGLNYYQHLSESFPSTLTQFCLFLFSGGLSSNYHFVLNLVYLDKSVFDDIEMNDILWQYLQKIESFHKSLR